MLCHAEHLAALLAAWPVAENRVIQLYELDPTHVAAQPAGYESSTERQSVKEFRSSLPFCLMSDDAPPRAVLLELDPTHLFMH